MVSAGLTLSAVACGGSGEEDGGDGGDGGDGPSAQLEIIAQNNLWVTQELEAPAGQDLTVVLDNEDIGGAHDFDIYALEDGEVGAMVFDGEIFPGVDTKTFTVPAFEAGEYEFICSVHPDTMVGTLTVTE